MSVICSRKNLYDAVSKGKGKGEGEGCPCALTDHLAMMAYWEVDA
jgi:hypothetical protein